MLRALGLGLQTPSFFKAEASRVWIFRRGLRFRARAEDLGLRVLVLQTLGFRTSGFRA